MKRGKLTLEEKYIIKGMVGDKKTVADIANMLDRTEKMVQKYIDTELETVCEHVAEASMKPSRQVISDTAKELIKAGLLELDANRIIDVVLSKAAENNVIIKDQKALFAECIKSMKSSHFMQKRTNGAGKGGVAIMTGAASQKMDDAGKTATRARSSKGAIYNIETGKIE